MIDAVRLSAHIEPTLRHGTISGSKTAPARRANVDRSLAKSTPISAKTREVSMATSQSTQNRRPQIAEDDPRHGTYAGAVEHWRSNVPLCEPCQTAQRRANKTAKLRRDRGNPGRIPLGIAAWQVIDGCTRTQLHHASGLNRNMLSRLHKGGPDGIVIRATRDRILASRVQFTPIGIQRRLQALTAIGYTSELIADSIGVHPSTLNNLRRREVDFVRHEFAKRIVEFYDDHQMQPLNKPISSAVARRQAEQHGWVAPLAWDCIDTDAEPASGRPSRVIDAVKVQRVLNGRPQDCNLDERLQVIDRWEGSIAALQRLTGWNIHRIINERKAA